MSGDATYLLGECEWEQARLVLERYLTSVTKGGTS